MNRSSLHPGRDGQESSFLYFSTAFVYQKLTLTETTDCSWRSLHFSRCTLRPRSIFFSLLHQRKILENTKEKQERVNKKWREEREKKWPQILWVRTGEGNVFHCLGDIL